MADRQRDDTWWIASDGKWYPASLQPDSDADPIPDVAHGVSLVGSSACPPTLTRVATVALVATSAAFALSAVLGLRYGSSLGSASVSAQDQTSAEDLFLGWSSLALFAMVVTGVLVLMWTYQTSKAFDSRSPVGRRWKGAWTIGSWFIPLASFVLPKLVFNELEKISQVPFTGGPIGDRWKSEARSGVGDLWWLLWVAGLFLLQSTQVFLTDPSVDEGTIAIATSLSGVAHGLLAAAGVSLAVVMRRIETESRA